MKVEIGRKLDQLDPLDLLGPMEIEIGHRWSKADAHKRDRPLSTTSSRVVDISKPKQGPGGFTPPARIEAGPFNQAQSYPDRGDRPVRNSASGRTVLGSPTASAGHRSTGYIPDISSTARLTERVLRARASDEPGRLRTAGGAVRLVPPAPSVVRECASAFAILIAGKAVMQVARLALDAAASVAHGRAQRVDGASIAGGLSQGRLHGRRATCADAVMVRCSRGDRLGTVFPSGPIALAPSAPFLHIPVCQFGSPVSRRRPSAEA